MTKETDVIVTVLWLFMVINNDGEIRDGERKKRWINQ